MKGTQTDMGWPMNFKLIKPDPIADPPLDPEKQFVGLIRPRLRPLAFISVLMATMQSMLLRSTMPWAEMSTQSTSSPPPEIPIQHPSSRDIVRQIDEVEAEIQATETGKSELLIPVKELRKDLGGLKQLDTTFGTVAASAYGVAQSDNDKFISEDWLLIKVAAEKAGINHIRGSVVLAGKPSRPSLAWTPRDSYGVFVNGVDQPREGMWVRKAGRSTGDTVGRIEFSYSHAKLLDNPVETREWTIVGSVFSEKDVFAVERDSGAPVVNRVGNLIGVVLGGVCGKPLELPAHDELGKVYVTYITPAPFLIQRIGQVFGRTVSVEVVDLDGIPGIIKADKSDKGDDSDS